MDKWEETEAWIMGVESEIAAAPKIAEYYPTQKRIFVDSNSQQFGQHYIGYANKADGSDQSLSGGSLVFEMEFEYTTPEDGPEVIKLIQALSDQMKADKELGPHNFSLLKFWHTEGRKGYKCIEICKSAAQYDKHCEVLSASAAGQGAARLGELVKSKSTRVYGTYGEVNASKFIPVFYADIEKIYGTPVDAAWGK